MTDTEEITRVINALGICVDAHRWADLEALFAPEVRLDYTSLFGGEAQLTTAGEMVAAWARFLPSFTATQHLITNHVIDVEGERASAQAQVQALHLLKEPELAGRDTWAVGGRYELELARLAGHWRITSLRLVATWQVGNTELARIAQARGASRARE